MIKNSIINIEKTKVKSLLQEIQSDSSAFVIEIDGRSIHSWEDYISQVEEAMRFPTTCVDSIDRYLDWIRDLSWLDKSSYTVIIYNISQFLEENANVRNVILTSFENTVLPWWESEIEQYQVQGKARQFNVYLVGE
jgi:hypothetical protein